MHSLGEGLNFSLWLWVKPPVGDQKKPRISTAQMDRTPYFRTVWELMAPMAPVRLPCTGLGIDVPIVGDFQHHLPISVGDYIPNSWVR